MNSGIFGRLQDNAGVDASRLMEVVVEQAAAPELPEQDLVRRHGHPAAKILYKLAAIRPIVIHMKLAKTTESRWPGPGAGGGGAGEVGEGRHHAIHLRRLL